MESTRPVAEPHRTDAESLADRLRQADFRASVDERDETLGKRIREAEVQKIPYVVVWGDRESFDELAVRRHGGDQFSLSLDGLLDALREDLSGKRGLSAELNRS